MTRWRWRWYEFVPEALLALALLGFLLDETDAATSALKSGRAVALAGLVAVVWLALRVGMARLVSPVALRMAVAAMAAVGVFSVVVLPAYRSDTVIEVFPDAAMPAERSPSASVVPGPSKLASGALRGIDHRAAGTASLYRRSDGQVVVGLEDIDIQPGPDYDLYLVPGGDKQGKDGGTKLDDLKGNKGTQFYDVPAAVDAAKGEWTVLVWCQTFAVPIANATLTEL